MNGHERILAMLEGRPADRLPLMPITMMYAGDHAGIKYGDYAADYRRLAEAQVAIARDYDFDFVSVISDPAREAADCGADIQFFDNQPPAINEVNALLDDKSVLDRLEIPDPSSEGRMLDRVRGVRLLKEQVGGDKLIEGWIEGPCAESADLRGINTLMLDFYDDPDFVRRLFDFVLEMGLRFAKVQLDAGAQLIGVGDAAASLIGPQLYDEFVWPYEKKLVDGLHALGAKVRLHICGNTSKILEGMGRLGCEHGRPGLFRLGGRRPPRDGAGPGAAGQPRPRPRDSRRHAGIDRGRHRRVPSASRPPLHRRRRLRNPPRHAAGQSARPDAIRPDAPA